METEERLDDNDDHPYVSIYCERDTHEDGCDDGACECRCHEGEER